MGRAVGDFQIHIPSSRLPRMAGRSPIWRRARPRRNQRQTSHRGRAPAQCRAGSRWDPSGGDGRQGHAGRQSSGLARTRRGGTSSLGRAWRYCGRRSPDNRVSSVLADRTPSTRGRLVRPNKWMTRRRHAVRAGVYLALFRHRSGKDRVGARKCGDSDQRSENLLAENMLPLLDEVVKAGRPLLVVADSFAPSPSISRPPQTALGRSLRPRD